MDLHLSDKTALVTGSTAGIGLEIARKLAVEGARVIITGRNKAKLDQAVDSIRTSGGARVNGVLADAATEEGAATLVHATPNVDILVNNLGIRWLRVSGASLTNWYHSHIWTFWPAPLMLLTKPCPDAPYDKEPGHDDDSRATLWAGVHRIYLPAPFDAPPRVEM